MSNALKEYLTLSQARVEVALDQRLPANTVLPKMLHDAMRYSTLDGGKRMRPMLTYSVGKALGIDAEVLDGAACAVEMIHVYRRWMMMIYAVVKRHHTNNMMKRRLFWLAMVYRP